MRSNRFLACAFAAILVFSVGVGLAYAFDPARSGPAAPETINQAVALIPCPYCMRLGTMAQRPCDDQFVVKCRGCGALGPPGESQAEAAENWNLRLYQP